MDNAQQPTTTWPLTAMQQGMLFHYFREPAGAAYFQQLQVRLEGRLDAALLQAAWQQVLNRHMALQMRFQWLGDNPVQCFDGDCRLPFTLVDYRQHPEAEQNGLLNAFLEDDRSKGFDPASPPLMRVALLSWSDESWELIWSHHHLILDGWSSSLVLAEVAATYTALLRGEVADAPQPKAFSEFLSWLGTRDNLAAEQYWRQTLHGFEQATSIPVLKRRAPSEQRADVVSLYDSLGGEFNAGLTRLTRKLGVTSVVPVLACWGLLLARYADTDDVLFGVTTSGRSAELDGAEQMIGLFINTFPLRMNANAESSIADWLIDLHKRLAGAREHEHTGLSKIAEWSGIMPGQPLFESILVYESYPLAMNGTQLGEAKIGSFHLEEQSNYPLSLIVEPGSDGLRMRLLADTASIAKEAAQALLEQFCFLLRQLAQIDAGQPVRQLSLLTAEQKYIQLQQWNDTARAYDTEATLSGLFLEQAERTPDAVALIDARGELSYRGLRDRVSQMAGVLAEMALPEASPVAVRLDRDRDMLVALLAIVSAGHHYVPIEPQLPAIRAEAILDSLPIRCLLTNGNRVDSSKALLAGRNIDTVCVDQTATLPVSDLVNRARPQHPAYVIFTSGSTGRPKGVLVLHRKAVNLIEWVNRSFQVGSNDKLLFVTSPAFDLSVYDIFGILAAGGTVRIAGETEIGDPERLLQCVLNEGITFWDSAPAALWQLESLLPAHAPTSALRLVFLSGDWIPLPLPGRMKAVFPELCVVALGGATEATIWSNYYVVDELHPDWVSIPYGRPIQNARYYILDSDLQPVPVGVPGDLYIGGECLAEGYVGQAELTAERFIADPYAPANAIDARIYRTGDRARFFPDGLIEFLGRLDNQVKIRGFRIELGDIEAAMNAHPAVRDCICIVHDAAAIAGAGPASGASNKELVAYFVVRREHSLSPEELRRYLEQRLPGPMVPSAVIRLEALPMTANGKVDRKNLPQPSRQAANGKKSSLSHDVIRQLVASAWCEVLALDSVSADDDFFSLGGHSLRATSVMARLRSALGLDLPLSLIFEYPTLDALSKAIRDAAPGGIAPEQIRIPVLDRQQGLPLSRAQARLWFLHQMEPNSANYNVVLAARITGRFRMETLTEAARQVMMRHEILNSVINAKSSHALMVNVGQDVGLPLQIVDLERSNYTEAQITDRLKQEAQIPFDLQRQRPLRLRFFRLSEHELAVMIVMHHIVTDGWSIALFAEELLQSYEALSNELPAPEQAPATQYADFSAWWESQVEEKFLAQELDYWKRQLAGLPRLQLPTDRPRPALSDFSGARLSFSLDAKTSAAVRQQAQRHSATLFMFLLTAFEVVLRRRSGQDEIVLGTDIAGRDHPLAEKIQGFFVNQLVLKTDFSATSSFKDMLEKVRETVLQGFFHQHVPFDVLVQTLNPARDLGGMPLFQHKFVLQNAPLANLENPQFEIQAIELHTDTAKYDLLLTVIDEPQLRGTLEFSTELFNRTTAEQLVQEWLAVVAQAASDPGIAYAGLVTVLDAEGEARSEAAKRELRKSGLQRLKDLRKTDRGVAV